MSRPTGFDIVDPTSGEVVDHTPLHDAVDVEARLAAANRAARDWHRRSLDDRTAVLRRAADLLAGARQDVADLVTTTMGKRTAEALGEVDKSVGALHHYAEQAGRYLAPESIETDPGQSTSVQYDPLGPILAIMPWNFPVWQVIRFAAPNLAAGNVGLLKHAPNVSPVALWIESLFTAAGAPDGVFQALVVDTDAVGAIIADDRVRGVTLTGSARAGAAVAAGAGHALKKTVLELGGSDAFIVLADADLDRAVEMAARSRLLNAGQTCVSAKRFLVEQPLVHEFAEALAEHFRAVSMGDPRDSSVGLGPLARADIRDTLADQVSRSVAAGATVTAGGRPSPDAGWYYAPTVLTDVAVDAPVATEETFGPVAAVTAVKDATVAVAVANATDYGLGASIFTADLERGRAMANHLEAGMVFINDMVRSDPRVPFGGVKRSGYGRELGASGTREFTNAKVVWEHAARS